MIIRVTFRDNDFTEALENYFKYNFLTATEEKYVKGNSEEDLIAWREARDARDTFEKILRDKNKFPEVEKRYFTRFLTLDILNYILSEPTLAKDFLYLKKNLKISVLNVIGEQWQNGEYVYYFPMHHKIITM